jgi:nucleotide-binding universal stress UspA family protein
VNTILFATDGSPSAQNALTEAVELAKATGWLLHVVTVWKTPRPSAYGYAAIPYIPEIAEEEKEHAGKIAQAAATSAEQAGLRATYEIREGRAATEICAVAAERDARLIVMGAHGWGAVRRVLSGSVSTAVVHSACRPVLIVRMADHELICAHDETLAVAS